MRRNENQNDWSPDVREKNHAILRAFKMLVKLSWPIRLTFGPIR